jgi:hypothetical protein
MPGKKPGICLARKTWDCPIPGLGASRSTSTPTASPPRTTASATVPACTAASRATGCLVCVRDMRPLRASEYEEAVTVPAVLHAPMDTHILLHTHANTGCLRGRWMGRTGRCFATMWMTTAWPRGATQQRGKSVAGAICGARMGLVELRSSKFCSLQSFDL